MKQGTDTLATVTLQGQKLEALSKSLEEAKKQLLLVQGALREQKTLADTAEKVCAG